MSQAISGGSSVSVAGELAVLLVEHEANQAESAEQARDAAREAFMVDAQRQVEALHDAANATMVGAFIGASMTVAGGALQISAAQFQYEVDMGRANGGCTSEVASNQLIANTQRALADVFSKTAEPTKALVGDSSAAKRQADAKRQESLAEQAKWQADDARTAVDKADKRGDKVLDVVQGLRQEESSSARSIIGRI